MDDLGEGLHLAGSVIDLVKDILDRADRDAADKQLDDDRTKIQNSFADNNADDQWTMAIRLLNATGHSFAAGGALGETDRQFRYHALIAIAELRYFKSVVPKLIQALEKKG